MSEPNCPEPEPTEAGGASAPEESGFDPLRTWSELVAELGDPTPHNSVMGIPEEDLGR